MQNTADVAQNANLNERLADVFKLLNFSAPKPLDYNKSMVHILATNKEYDRHSFWQPAMTKRYSLSGFIIENKLIVTNAHGLSNPAYLQVELQHKSRHYEARVVAIGYEYDLALITVDDADFWVDTQAFELEENFKIDESLKVLGFPGKGSLAISRGAISRCVLLKSQDQMGELPMLAIQTDAAINTGNSGGPALNMDNKVIGISVSIAMHKQQTSFLIPVESLNTFLKEINAPGGYRPKYGTGLTLQNLGNLSLRAHHQLPPHLSGVLVANIAPFSQFRKTLKVGDIILAIGEWTISNDNKIDYRDSRIGSEYLFARYSYNDVIEFKVYREGMTQSLTHVYEVQSQSLALLERLKPNQSGSYYIVNGFIFKPTYHPDSCEDILLSTTKMLGEQLALNDAYKSCSIREQHISIDTVFENQFVAGYDFESERVFSINGIEVSDIQALVQAFETNTKAQHSIKLVTGLEIITDNLTFDSRHQDLLTEHQMGFDRSEDLRAKPKPK